MMEKKASHLLSHTTNTHTTKTHKIGEKREKNISFE